MNKLLNKKTWAALILGLGFGLLTSACQQTVKLEAPDKPIDINVNINENTDTATITETSF